MPIYAKLADEPHGVLEHLCDAVQPGLDQVFQLLQEQEFLYDPDLCPSGWLDWLQQLVGGAPIGDHWLGLGLNPAWPDFWKRYVVSQLYGYWQIKGTAAGIRKGVDLWLGWGDKAYTKRLCLVLPFGKTPTAEPPNWWHWNTPYGTHLNQAYQERQHLGSGDNFGAIHHPDWTHLVPDREYWDYYEPWNTLTLEQVTGEVMTDRKSNLGPWNPWMHFRVTALDWALIFPNIFELNLELWEAGTDPTVWGWMNVPIANPVTLQENPVQPKFESVTEFDVDGMHYGSDWWPYHVKPASTHVETTVVDVTFEGFPGWRWGDAWWGGIGGDFIPPAQRQRTETVETIGNWPGAQWADEWYSAQWLDRTVTQTPYAGNFRASAIWFNPWNSGYEWYFPPGSEDHVILSSAGSTGSSPYYAPTTSTTSVVIDPGAPSVTVPYPGTLWYARSNSYQETITTTVPDPPSDCLLGAAFALVTGYEDTWVGGLPGTPPSQLLSPVPSFTETIVVKPADPGVLLGFQWGYWWLTIAPDVLNLAIEWPSPAIDWGTFGSITTLSTADTELTVDALTIATLTLDVSVVAVIRTLVIPSERSELTLFVGSLARLQGWTLDTTALGSLETLTIAQPETINGLVRQVNRVEALLVSGFDCWQAQPSAAVETVITHPVGWTLADPVTIATYDKSWGEGWEWYAAGTPAVPPHLEKTPVTTLARLCNTTAAWSMHLLAWLKRYQRLIPPERGLTPFDFFPILKTVSDYRQWRCVVQTPLGLFVLKPTAMFWTDAVYGAGTPAKRSQTVSLDDRTLNLYMEFLITPLETTTIQAVTLLLGDETFRCEMFYEPVSFAREGYFGFRYTIPFRFANGAETFNEYLAINRYGTDLQRQEPVLHGADLTTQPTIGDLPVLDDSEFLPTVVDSSTLIQLLQKVDTDVQTLMGEIQTFKASGDLNYVWETAIPVTSAIIPIPNSFKIAGKIPEITLIDNHGQPFTADCRYGDNLITVTLSEPVIFKAALN